ncbi:hypothetical protein BJ546DRAFT_432315 [Cryomyces antarcticus]
MKRQKASSSHPHSLTLNNFNAPTQVHPALANPLHPRPQPSKISALDRETATSCQLEPTRTDSKGASERHKPFPLPRNVAARPSASELLEGVDGRGLRCVALARLSAVRNRLACACWGFVWCGHILYTYTHTHTPLSADPRCQRVVVVAVSVNQEDSSRARGAQQQLRAKQTREGVRVQGLLTLCRLPAVVFRRGGFQEDSDGRS